MFLEIITLLNISFFAQGCEITKNKNLNKSQQAVMKNKKLQKIKNETNCTNSGLNNAHRITDAKLEPYLPELFIHLNEKRKESYKINSIDYSDLTKEMSNYQGIEKCAGELNSKKIITLDKEKFPILTNKNFIEIFQKINKEEENNIKKFFVKKGVLKKNSTKEAEENIIKIIKDYEKKSCEWFLNCQDSDIIKCNNCIMQKCGNDTKEISVECLLECTEVCEKST